MKILTLLGTTLAAFGVLAAQVPEDPVLRARVQRGLSDNLNDGDLPPVPRVITEPPSLPPPEINHKDLRRSKASRRHRSRRKIGKQTRVRSKHPVRRPPRKIK